MQQKDGCFHSSDKFRIFWYWKLVKSIALKQYFFYLLALLQGSKSCFFVVQKELFGSVGTRSKLQYQLCSLQIDKLPRVPKQNLSFKNRTIIALYCFISLRETFSLEILHVFSNPQEEFMDENLTKTKSSGFWSLCPLVLPKMGSSPSVWFFYLLSWRKKLITKGEESLNGINYISC